jgi:hypothetical protein
MHEFKFFFFFFFLQNFKQKAPLSRFSSNDRESLCENIINYRASATKKEYYLKIHKREGARMKKKNKKKHAI